VDIGQLRNQLTAKEIIKISDHFRKAIIDSKTGVAASSHLDEVEAILVVAHAEGRLSDPQSYMQSLIRALTTDWILDIVASSTYPVGEALEIDALDERRRKGYRVTHALGL
jgi:hypothetical protein